MIFYKVHALNFFCSKGFYFSYGLVMEDMMKTISILNNLMKKKVTIIFNKLEEKMPNCEIISIDKSIIKVRYLKDEREIIKVIPIRNIFSIIMESEDKIA